MKRTIATIVAGAAVLGATFDVRAEPSGARAGRWEIVKTIESSDPQANGRTVTAVRCFSEADVAAQERLVPSQRETDERCTVRNVRRSKSGEVTWTATCQMPGVSRSATGTMTVAAERFDASAKLEGRAGGRTVRSVHKVVGRRVGACP